MSARAAGLPSGAGAMVTGRVWPDILGDTLSNPVPHRVPQVPPGHGMLEVLTAAFAGQLWMPGPAGPPRRSLDGCKTSSPPIAARN